MRVAPPWWLRGEDRCQHCLQLYAREVERRCADCDAPGCPNCTVVVTERSLVLCPGCRE